MKPAQPTDFRPAIDRQANSELESAIAAKIKAGLTREQALFSLKNQAAFTEAMSRRITSTPNQHVN
jgi:hypothetical protein